LLYCLRFANRLCVLFCFGLLFLLIFSIWLWLAFFDTLPHNFSDTERFCLALAVSHRIGLR
jgi:hypothetical protein